MSDAIIVALITGSLALVGVLINGRNNKDKIVSDIKLEVAKYQAVTDTKIEELTREVREHNNFARRMPVVEEQIKSLQYDLQHLKKL